jgi:hypothetical protein
MIRTFKTWKETTATQLKVIPYWYKSCIVQRQNPFQELHVSVYAYKCITRYLTLNHFKQRIINVTSFRLSKYLYSRSARFNRTDNFDAVFTNQLDRGIYENKFRHTSSFFVPFSVCRITVTFPSTPKAFLLFVTVAMLSHFLSPVNRRSIKAEGNFTHKMNRESTFHASGSNEEEVFPVGIRGSLFYRVNANCQCPPAQSFSFHVPCG